MRRPVRAPKLAALLAAALSLASLPAAAQGNGPVYRVPVTGTVEMGLAPFVERSLREAAEAGASAVVLDVDT
ncbi:MAG TPA: hypothetical protein VF263_13720, partial [Longimicrobiaceae bacterium]